MPFERSAGILLHPTSLPSLGGIGDLGKEAYAFADFLFQARLGLWQVLHLLVWGTRRIRRFPPLPEIRF
jgi:4-alpha-glucanotransferase